MENKAFGELAAPPENRWSTTTGSGVSRVLRAFISTFERMCIFPKEIMRGTDNLYNYNIYKNIKHTTTTTATTTTSICRFEFQIPLLLGFFCWGIKKKKKIIIIIIII